MSATFQAIIHGARAAAQRTGWCCQLVRRPRGRRQALAIRQDAPGV